jgi:hypothetical protein
VVILVERMPVKSRILRSVGYDDTTKNLEIEFQSGLVYQYLGVPPKVYTDLIRSGEIGKYFIDKVRNRFRTKQVVT